MNIERIEIFRSREESRVEYSHALLPGIFPKQGWNLRLKSPALIGGFFTASGTLEALQKNVLCLVVQSCLTLCSSMDCSPPGSSVHGDSPGKKYCRGLPCPSPGDLPNPEMEPRSPTLQADSLSSEPP